MPKGDLRIEFEWMGNKSYLASKVLFRHSSFPAGKHMNPETLIVGYNKKEAETKAWFFKFTDQGQASAGITPGKLVVRQQEGKRGQEGYRMQQKTYELIDNNTMSITTISETNSNEPTADPPLTLKRQDKH